MNRQHEEAPPVGDSQRYRELGVSTSKSDVYRAIEALPVGVSERTFCKVMPEVAGAAPGMLNVSHSDGAGTKSILAYLLYRLTGRLDGFRQIAQDAIVMNLDDLLCVGATTGFLLTSIVNRNARLIDGAVLREIIQAKQEFADLMRTYDVDIQFVGGETADVGDIVRTLLVDANLTCRFPATDLLINRITPHLAVVGLESSGPPAKYETSWNSGISCNGITLARHELLGQGIHHEFPEICDTPDGSTQLYRGPYAPLAPLPGTELKVLEALLCPTRTFAPILRRMFRECRQAMAAVIHNTGGAHTKCLRYLDGSIVEKDLGANIPAVFRAIQEASHLAWPEMCKVFNLGYRMEIYCEPAAVGDLVSIAKEFGVGARELGRTLPALAGDAAKLRVRIEGNSYEIR